MKTHYTLRKLLFVFAITGLSMACCAQHATEHINANNVNAGFGIGGNLFSRIDSNHLNPTWQMLEVPKGSSKVPVYTASLWMSGYDAGNNLHCAAQRYAQTGHDFYDGPIVANYTSEYDNYYRRVFKITRSQITHHQSLGFTIPVGQIDSAILFWPAKNNPYVIISYGVAISSKLAPYVDVDADGNYNPAKGDYPDICGEEAIFFVFNDDRAAHHETGGAKLGVEVRGLAEVFVDQVSTNTFEKRAINNTVFVSYEVENKSADNLSAFYLGMFEDPDLGCFSNDRVACDTVRNLEYVYNGTGTDPDCNGVIGYGQKAVASGTKFLNSGLSSFSYFTNGAPASQADPSSCTEYRNYLTSHWADGTPFTQGGNGYNGVIPTKYIFPGDPNNPNDWVDGSGSGGSGGAILSPGDRRMQGSSGPSSFTAGETKHFDFAFTTSYDSSATNLTIVDTLKRDADVVQSFYDNSIVTCRATHQIPLGVNTVTKDELAVRVYPNPSSNQINIETAEPVELLELTDLQGRSVLSKASEARKITLDVSALMRGVYLLRVKSEGKTAVKKLVME